ncbi:MAG: hypothetical protein K2H86_08560 [Muribaculaceae bacterium]|nr:hypothetical protein [Muribaculaceae bacterium]
MNKYTKYFCTGIALILSSNAAVADDTGTDASETLIATFNIPQLYDPDYSLNTDSKNGLTPYNLYTNPNYSNDIIRKVFSDFTGPGYITYNYSLKDLHDADGTVYYPLWLLGFDDNGGNITFHFSNEYVSDYGVNISKVIIRGAQNRFSKDNLAVSVNGQTQYLPYTPHSNNIPSGNESLHSSVDLEFDFPAASAVESVTLTCENYGMGFSSIDFYVGEPQQSIVPEITFSGLDKTGTQVLGYTDAKIALLPVVIIKDGQNVTPEQGYRYVYTISDADGTELAQVEGMTDQECLYSFPCEGRYTISVKTEDEAEASYTLELYPRFEDLNFICCGMIDSILNIQDFTGEEDGETHEKRDLTCARLFELPEDVELYYHLWKDENFHGDNNYEIEQPEFAPSTLADDDLEGSDADDTTEIPEGYTRYDHNTGINLEGNNSIDTIIRKNGILSPKQTIRYSLTNVAVSVKDIKADTDLYTLYSIDGRHLPTSAKGLVIRVTPDGKAHKVIVP